MVHTRNIVYIVAHCQHIHLCSLSLFLSSCHSLHQRYGIDLSTRYLLFLCRCPVSPLILSPYMAFRVVTESVHVFVYHLFVFLLLISFPSFCLHDMSHFTLGFSVSLSLAIITQAASQADPGCESGTWVALVNAEVIHEQMQRNR